MTEEEVLKKMDQFKEAIISLKSQVKILTEENAKLKSGLSGYSEAINAKVSELDQILSSAN